MSLVNTIIKKKKLKSCKTFDDIKVKAEHIYLLLKTLNIKTNLDKRRNFYERKNTLL